MRTFRFVLLVLAPVGAFAIPVEDIDFFEKKVRPVLVNHCYACHSAATKPAGGLRVDDRNGLLNGGATGPAVVPGDPKASLLVERVQHEDPKRRMPKEGDLLTKAELEDVVTWIKNGAAWPAEKIPEALLKPKPNYERLRARHWAYPPLKPTKAPAVATASWPRSDVDRFILAKLEERKLTPAPDAGRVDSIRRVTFDLTGLPPRPEEIQAFLADDSPKAYERLVD